MNLIPPSPGLYLRPRHLLIPKRDIEAPIGEMSGWFKMEAVNAETGERRLLADWFPNLITDGGLERLGTGSILNACQVGSGNAAPTVSDTQLQTRVAGTSTVLSQLGGSQASPPYYAYSLPVYRFAAGAAAGNLSEVGVGWTTTATLFSRALILDGGGNPTTITVLSNEFLDVSYELRLYPPLVDSNFQIVISGVTYTCVMRAAGVTGSFWSVPSSGVATITTGLLYSGAIGATIVDNPSGASGGNSTEAIAAYAANSKRRDYTIDWGLTAGNVGAGAASARFIGSSNNSLGGYQVSFSPAIPKDNTKTLSLSYRVQWSRRP